MEKNEFKYKVLLDLRPYSNITVQGDDIDQVVDDTMQLFNKLNVKLGLVAPEPMDSKPEPVTTPVVGTSGTFKPATKENVLKLPNCPVHGVAMRKKTGPYGSFFGCPEYPRCKEVIRLDKR
jgi:hypothetical protein